MRNKNPSQLALSAAKHCRTSDMTFAAAGRRFGCSPHSIKLAAQLLDCGDLEAIRAIERGERRLFTVDLTRATTVRVADHQHARLVALRVRSGVPVNRIVFQALAAYLDLADRASLVAPPPGVIGPQ